MTTTTIIDTGKGQVVELPDEFRFKTNTVSIRREGEAVILEPVKSDSWPADFFENIRIEDSAFVRPDQGVNPGQAGHKEQT